jgi:hypothetical protein
MAKAKAPAGSNPIFALRRHQGRVYRRYIGYRLPGQTQVWIYSHRDDEHQPCELRELGDIPPWDPAAALSSATGEGFGSLEELGAWLMQEFPSLTRLFPNLTSTGRKGPDHGAKHAQSGSGRRAAA